MSSTNNLTVSSPTSMFRGTLFEIALINLLFLGVCYFKVRWNPKKESKKEMHLVLDAFFKYTIVYVGVSLALKWYNPDMAKSFIGTGLYHAAYTLHSFIAYRDGPGAPPMMTQK